jgi:hypothetical protein
MTYTFRHAGILIGESDLEEASGDPGPRGGVFRPTAYGLQVFPRLTGILSAGCALELDLESKGMSQEELERGDFQEAPRDIVSARLRRGPPGLSREGRDGRCRPRHLSEFH